MSDNLKHIDVDSDEFEDAPRALRDYVKKLQGQNTTLTKERDDARGKFAAKTVADVLDGKGFKNPARVQKDLLEDGIDPTDTTAVEGWLEKNSGDYAQAEAAPAAEEKPAPDAVPEEVRLGYQNLQVPGTPASASAQAIFDQITPEMDGQAVIALYKQHGL